MGETVAEQPALAAKDLVFLLQNLLIAWEFFNIDSGQKYFVIRLSVVSTYLNSKSSKFKSAPKAFLASSSISDVFTEMIDELISKCVYYNRVKW